MQLPVLFKHVEENGVVARIKQYEVKAHHFLVDLEEDAKVFLDQGFHLVKEGEDAEKHLANLLPKEKKTASKAAPTAKDDKAAK